jgi:hypothetical protein
VLYSLAVFSLAVSLQRCCCCCLQLNKSLREKLSALHTTHVLAGLLGDVLVAARRLRELLAAPAAGANADAAAVVKLLKLALDPVEQQVRLWSAVKTTRYKGHNRSCYM